MLPRTLLLVALLPAAAVLAGCSGAYDSDATTSTNGGPFTFNGSFSEKTTVEEKTWLTSASKARVSLSGGGSIGTANVVVKDGAGKQVYSGSLGGGATGGSSTVGGSSGTWRITISTVAYTGSISLTLTPS